MPFAKKAPAETDLVRARAMAGRIHSHSTAGASAPEIARMLRLPVGAVEAVLAGPPPEAPGRSEPSPRLTVPVGGDAILPGAPTAPPYAGPFTPPTSDSLLFELLKEAAVPDPVSRGIVRRMRHFPPDDVGRLEGILTDASLSPTTRRMVLSAYREELQLPAAPKAEAATPTREPEGPLAVARRTLEEGLQLRLLEAQVREAERRAKGEPEGASAEVVQLRGQVATLENALRERQMLDHLAHAIEPLRREIEEMKKHPGNKTPQDVAVSSVEEGIALIVDRLKGAPKLPKSIVESPDFIHALTKTAQRVLVSDEEMNELPLLPTPEQMRVFQQRAEAEERAMNAQNTTTPESATGLLVPVGRPVRPTGDE
jgi:hypothetical protein